MVGAISLSFAWISLCRAGSAIMRSGAASINFSRFGVRLEPRETYSPIYRKAAGCFISVVCDRYYLFIKIPAVSAFGSWFTSFPQPAAMNSRTKKKRFNVHVFPLPLFFRHYRSQNCIDCPLKSACTKAKVERGNPGEASSHMSPPCWWNQLFWTWSHVPEHKMSPIPFWLCKKVLFLIVIFTIIKTALRMVNSTRTLLGREWWKGRLDGPGPGFRFWSERISRWTLSNVDRGY